MSLYIRHEFPVETVGASGSCGGLFFCIDFQIRISLAQQCAVGKQIAMLAFSMFMLKGFTIYSSAPIWSPSRMFFSSPSAVSSTTGMWDVSISFLMAMHNSSPRISGIMMSERNQSRPELFYNGQRFLAVVAYLYIVNRRERLEEIVAQLVIVFYNQDAMQFVIVFSPEFSGQVSKERWGHPVHRRSSYP